MPDEQRQSTTVYRRAAMEPKSYNAEERTIDVVWTTGADVVRVDPWTGKRYTERLDVKGADLSRLNDGAPFLDSHDSWSSRSVIGVVVPGSARIENGRGVAKIRLSAADSAADAVQKIVEGTLRNISVGYSVQEWAVEKDERSGSELRTAVRWQPAELSGVPIPADAGAQVRAAEREQPAQENPMTEQTKPAEVHDLDAIRAAAAADAEKASAKRAAEILDLGKRHGYDVTAHIANNDSIDKVRAAILDARAKADKETEIAGTHGAQVRAGRSHVEQVLEGIENAVAHRSLPRGTVELTPAGRHFRSMDLARMAEVMLREQGIDTNLMSKREIGKAAMKVDGIRSFSSAHTTGDFPYILANVANKFLLMGYDAEPMTHMPFSYERTVQDLKQVSTVRLGSISALPKVVEGAEFTYATIGEEREQYTVAKYGQILPFTLEMLINDDLSAFSRLAEELGRAAGRTELDLVYGSSGVLGSNSGAGEAMGDGNNLFDASNHNNQASGHTALSASGWAALRLLLRNQTDVNGNRINLSPTMLLVPAALETTAEQLVSGVSLPVTDATAQSPTLRAQTVIVEPRIDDISNGSSAYYAISKPFVELGKLAGYERPTFESFEQQDADQIGYKVRYFVAAKATDWRQIARDPGA